MKNYHIFVLMFKLIFVILLLLAHFNLYFNKNSPAVIVSHYTLIISFTLYIIYIANPFNKNKISFEKEDFLFIIIICLMLLNTIDLSEYKKNIYILCQNIKKLL